MSSQIRKAFLHLAKQNIHYRYSGAGQAIVLLHPSPLSSAFMQPLMQAWAIHGRTVAWDTPGYGESDPLPDNGEGLQPYVDCLASFIRELKLGQVLLYGSATGAQIAIEFGKAYPELCHALLLENAADFTDAEREQIQQGYFPSLAPTADGTPFHTAWDIARKLYQAFPWYEAKAEESRMPLALTQQTALDYLRAGPDYDRAYRAAFANERAEALRGLSIPCHIVNWSGSIIYPYSERLKQAKLPANIHIHEVAGDLPARYDYLSALVKKLVKNG